MIQTRKSENYRVGRWLNGLGLSWDIAAAPDDAGAQDFDWRMAIARIDSSVAFSIIPMSTVFSRSLKAKGLIWFSTIVKF